MTARVWPVDAVTGAPSYAGRALRQLSVSPGVAQATGSRPLGGLSGVRPGTPITIATATSTVWTVTPFLGMIDGEASAIAGVYSYAFDANKTGSVTAAAGSARVDRLDVQVSDPAESDGSSVPGVDIIRTDGTPGSGVPAAAPARSHPLALINVPASGGGSPTVTWNATYYCAPGGFVPFNTLTGLNAWTTASLNQHASVVNDSTTQQNGDYTWSGAAWVATPVGLLATVSAPGSNADYTTTATALTTTVGVVSGRTYRVTAYLRATQITATGIPAADIFIGGVSSARLLQGQSYSTSAPVTGIATWFYTAGSTASVAFDLRVSTSAGALRLGTPANGGPCQIAVEQVG